MEVGRILDLSGVRGGWCLAFPCHAAVYRRMWMATLCQPWFTPLMLSSCFLVCATLVMYNAPCVEPVSEFCSKGTLIPELPVK
jgi:hypothetical protein